MIITIHIAFALVSLLYSTYTAITPSPKKLKFTYLLMFGTLTSGIMLSLNQRVNIAQTCIIGLAYTGFVLTSIFLAKRKITSIEL